MRIAICDDCRIMHNDLKRYLEKYGAIRNLDMVYDDYLNGSDLLASNIEYDIIFMDYQMDGLDGIETARKLKQRKDKAMISFLTRFEHVVFQAFEVNAFRFLLKPIDMEKLTAALDDYIEDTQDDEYIFIQTDDGHLRICADDIIYAEASNKYCYIRTIDEDIMFKNTLSEFEKLVPSDRFFRSHRSFLVGFRHIISHTTTDILFDNQEKAIISKLKLTPFKKAFTDYVKRYNFTRR